MLPLRTVAVALLVGCIAMGAVAEARSAALQSAAPPQNAGEAQVAVNPRAIEVDPPVATNDAAVTGYRIEIFPVGTDTRSATPSRAFDVPRAESQRPNQRAIRIELAERLAGLPDGQYVVTVRAVGRDVESARSRPTPPFAVAGRGAQAAPPAAVASPERPAPEAQAPAAAGAPGADPPEDPDEAKRRRTWTIVGISIGAAAFLLQFLAR